MANYYQIPQEFLLGPNPKFHMISLNHVRLLSSDLRSQTVNYINADPRCDRLKLIMRRGEGNTGESVTVLCAPDIVNTNVPLYAGLNLLTESHKWLYKENCNSRPLSLVFLSEDHVGLADSFITFNTYVKFLKPDVLVVSEGVFATRLHDKLLDVYSKYTRAQLQNEGNNILWLYYNQNNVTVSVSMEVGFGFVDIERVTPAADEGSEVEAGAGAGNF